MALLAAYGHDLIGLLARWGQAMTNIGVRLAHTPTTPASPLRHALSQIGICIRLPYARTPYYLTSSRWQIESRRPLSTFQPGT